MTSEQLSFDASVLQQLRDISEATGLSEVSGDVSPGDVFIACSQNSEQRHGHIDQAIQAGAVGLVIDEQAKAPLNARLPVIRVADLAARRGLLASQFYEDPTADIECVGVTGTNGKTSIAYHVSDLTNALGKRGGYSGTLGSGSPGSLTLGSMTTPPPVTLQRQFAHFREQGMERVALEVSSHALDQNRARDVHFDVGVFSNLTRDHLDYHQTMEKYAAAKAKMFTTWPLKLAVINADDDMGRKLIGCVRASEVLSYGASGDISWRATPVRRGMHVLFDTPWGRLESTMPIAVEFAVANVAAAIGVLLGSGHAITDLGRALTRMRTVPGRMEVVPGAYGTPKVVVDYAHTPDALEKVLTGLAAQCRGRLICVVGCGGNRDRGKRPEMAQVASNLSDHLWLTSDNPRDEAPADILHDMLSGLSMEQRQHASAVEDRGAAIAQAVRTASVDDLVVIAGKGHEDTQEIAGVKYPFSDVAYVENMFKENA